MCVISKNIRPRSSLNCVFVMSTNVRMYIYLPSKLTSFRRDTVRMKWLSKSGEIQPVSDSVITHNEMTLNLAGDLKSHSKNFNRYSSWNFSYIYEIKKLESWILNLHLNSIDSLRAQPNWLMIWEGVLVGVLRGFLVLATSVIREQRKKCWCGRNVLEMLYIWFSQY